MKNELKRGKRTIAYLCLQRTTQGQASYAHVHEIISGLRRLDWKVSLFEPTWPVGRQIYLVPLKIFDFFVAQMSLWLHIRQYSIIYVRSHFFALPTMYLAKWLRIPTVLEVNGPLVDAFIAYPWTQWIGGILAWSSTKALSLANEIITVTPELARSIRNEVHKSRVTVIPNGANTDLFHPKAVCTVQAPTRYVIFFGALAKWQGIDTVLKAVESKEWPKTVSLVIAGDGAERISVQLAMANNPIVQYVGVVPYDQMPGLIAGSIGAIVPMNRIGDRGATGLSPLKLYESLACGIPVVVTDFPGQAELVRENNCGFVVPPESSTAIAEAVSILSTAPSLRKEMGKRGALAVIEHHSWFCRSSATNDVLRHITT